MFEVIRYQIGQDEQLFHKYESDIGKLAMLMRHEGTALERMVDWIEFSRFQFGEHDLKQLAEPLYQWFQEHHPQKLPVCLHCSKSSNQAKVFCDHLVLVKLLIKLFSNSCAVLATHSCAYQLADY